MSEPHSRPGHEELPGWRHVYSGKVRDLYVPDAQGPAREGPAAQGPAAQGPAAQGPAAQGAGDVVLVVASDRISAFDHVLATPVPDKGRVLTALSLWWFERLADLVPNHLLSATEAVPAPVRGRAMLCRRLEMVPIECVARGYLTGSGLVEYRAGLGADGAGSVCGVPLPDGLDDGSRLPEPIFTPAAKAELGAHDENVSYAQVAAQVGERTASRLRELTLAVYRRAEEITRPRGVILADTKLEFGRVPGRSDELVLGDEVLTPDSSRFWPADTWRPGRAQPSFDKQYVRDWLTSPEAGWDRNGTEPPPPLPAAVVEHTRERYLEAFRRITGRPLG